jgi:hypothetical protein
MIKKYNLLKKGSPAAQFLGGVKNSGGGPSRPSRFSIDCMRELVNVTVRTDQPLAAFYYNSVKGRLNKGKHRLTGRWLCF